jgi:hypothetical protein
MSEFSQFMRGLKADARLGRCLPGKLAEASPEVIVLALCTALADAQEGRQIHPAYQTLDEIDAMREGRR